jgi:hypothetical protein
MFKIKFLPARFGDAIWIEYGDEGAAHRLLIDGGTAGTRKDIRREFETLDADQRNLELLVVTHIDRDHIEGVLGLLSQGDPGFTAGDVWFNGWNHLPSNPRDVDFGAIQGERLTSAIRKNDLPWNQAFAGGPVVTPGDGSLPQINLPGGMRLTLLSPTREALEELRPKWEQEVREANLDPGFGMPSFDVQVEEEEFGAEELPDVEALAATDFEKDDSEANASSIALLAEFEGKRALLAADAHADVLISALDRLSPDGPLSLDLFKVSHHGSKFTTNLGLIEKVKCPKYVFSTNGSIFHHPDEEVIARVLTAGGEQPQLFFNYRSKHNEVWDLRLLRERHGYSTRYPAGDEKGIEVEV